LLRHGKHVLVEKPITETVAQAEQLVAEAKSKGLVFQVGHLERFNPAVEAVENMISDPKFIEVQRLGSFSARSLDVDVVLDLMIHDLDIILALIKDEVGIIRSSGIHVLSEKNRHRQRRLEFKSGCVATLTASRVHQGKVRKLRIFEPTAYYSIRLHRPGGQGFPPERPADGHQNLQRSKKEEPLKKEIDNFLTCINEGRRARSAGRRACAPCAWAHAVLKEIGAGQAV